MIVIQIILGYIALKKLINYNLDYRSLYSLEDIKSIVSWAIIVILIALSFILFTIEGVFTVTLFYRGNWQYYGELWRKTILNTPLWARYMNALVVPFSAGIFEEIIWRAYGITALELITTTKKAVLIQAVAFGLWHIINPIHIIPAFIIGTIYGIIYVKRRKILTLSIAHIVTNLVGFSIWIL
jgi:membrane protease YdiL (CAAX protease family)